VTCQTPFIKKLTGKIYQLGFLKSRERKNYRKVKKDFDESLPPKSFKKNNLHIFNNS